MQYQKVNALFLTQLAITCIGISFLSCQAPLFQGAGSRALRLELTSAVPGLLPSSPAADVPAAADASRALTPDASTIAVSISRDDTAKVLFSQDVTVGVNDSGQPSARVVATNIPLQVALTLLAQVKDSSGVVLFQASRSLTLDPAVETPDQKLLLVPASTYPGLVTVRGIDASLTIPAASYRILAMDIAAAQTAKTLRLYWPEVANELSIALVDPSGTALASSLILDGKAGATFTPSQSGTHFAIITNPGTEPQTLAPIACGDDLVSISLDTSLSKAVVFSPSQKTVNKGETLVIANDSLASLSGWKWYVDGLLEASQTGSTFSWSTASKTAGQYQVGVSVISEGLSYSGNFRLTVREASTTSFSVSYSSQDADGGDVPFDATAYAANASVTLAGNTGNLTRSGWSFVGWTDNAAGTGIIYKAGASYTLGSANVTFYPKWAIVSPYAGTLLPVPGGSYQRDATAANVTRVSSFFVGQKPVTQAQYLSVIGSNPSSNTSSPNNPVETVNWYSAIAFCNKLSALEGLTPVYSYNGGTDTSVWTSANYDAAVCDPNANGYRLPTDAEYAWAAMGGNQDSKPGDIVGGVNVGGYAKAFAGSDGSNSMGSYVWSNGNSGSFIQVVGTALANELGLYDMSGNVYQWCWDRYAAFPSGSLRDYAGGPSGTNRILRSGAFTTNSALTLFQPGYRSYNAASYSWNDVGFRVVRSAPGNKYLPRSGLVGEWLLDGNPNDSSGSNHTVYSLAGVSYSSSGRAGLSANIASGASNTITFNWASDLAFSSGQAFTVSVWFKTNTGVGEQYIFSQGGDSYAFDYLIAVNSSNQIDAGTSRHNVTGLDTIVPWAISSGRWYHACLLFDTSNVKLYVDNVLEASSSYGLGALAATSSDGLAIGGHWGRSSVQTVDNLRIYNRALSAAEITALFQEQ